MIKCSKVFFNYKIPPFQSTGYGPLAAFSMNIAIIKSGWFVPNITLPTFLWHRQPTPTKDTENTLYKTNISSAKIPGITTKRLRD